MGNSLLRLSVSTLFLVAILVPSACRAVGCAGDRLTIGERQVCVEIAESAEAIGRGLSWRDSLGENQGMLFIFQNSGHYAFWMKDMRFPLDFIWIADGSVVDLTENVPIPVGEPLPMYRPRAPVNWVLEVNAGFAARNKIVIGDRVTLERKATK